MPSTRLPGVDGPGILYISYDGALEPLGRSQVVPLVERLGSLGARVQLLTFERSEAAEGGALSAMRARLERAGVGWTPLRYHRSPTAPATAYDMLAGIRVGAGLIHRHRLQLVHARSYPPALVAHALNRLRGLPYMFDIRGLYPEERVDAGLWTRGSHLFRLTKRLERTFFRQAAVVVTLTRKSLPVLEAELRRCGSAARLEVIPTTVDLDRFRPRDLKPSNRTIAYSGSVGGWYMLDETMSFCASALQHGYDRALFLVNQHEDLVRAAAASAGVPPGLLDVQSVPHEAVPGRLSEATLTVSLVRPTYSKVASAATKFAESLAMGLPVVVNEGVGDAADLVVGDRVGAVVDPFNRDSFGYALAQLDTLLGDPSLAHRCRAVAERESDVGRAAQRYLALYASMVTPTGARHG